MTGGEGMRGRPVGSQGRRTLALARLLLRLAPPHFRQTHGEELLAHVLRESTHPRFASSSGRLRFQLQVAGDLARTVLRLRLAPHPRSSFPPHHRSRPGGGRLSACTLDLRYALRSLAGTPLLAAVVVLTLALGIGMNTAIFSVVDGVLLEPLAYREPGSLVYVDARWSTDGVEQAPHTGADFRDIRATIGAFADVAAATSIRQNLTGGEVPLQAQVGWVSPNLFSLLGVGAAAGRTFDEADPPGTAMVSYAVWQRHFGGDPTLVGRALRLDGHPYTVVGIAPRQFRLHLPNFPRQIDVWKVPDDWWQNGNVWWEEARGGSFGLFELIGRLADGSTPEQAESELGALARSWRSSYREYAEAGLELGVSPLRSRVVGDVRTTLLLLFGAVGLVLLIACANVLNLMLVRAEGRRREIALRLALGSSPGRIVRLLLIESLLLALLGGGAGIGLALGGVRLLLALRPEDLPRLANVSVDATVLGFAAGVALLCTLLFGLLPAVGAARRGLAAGMGSERASAGRPRLGRLLVVGQISLSLVLLVAAGLLFSSLRSLRQVDPGFEPRQLLTFAVSLPGTGYERPLGTDRFLRRLEERIEALPDVRSAGVVWPMPLSGRSWSGQYVGGSVGVEQRQYAEYRLATAGYFPAIGVPILTGRSFTPQDRPHVVLVSRKLAERTWPGESVVGKTLEANPWGGGDERFEVLGVVEDLRYADLREEPTGTLYFPAHGWSWTDWEVHYVVRTTAAPETLVGPIRSELRRLDAEIPLAQPRPMAAFVDENLASNRFALTLVGLFGAVAALLATIGLYGLLSYSVSQRRREIGIRLALGSERRGVVRLVLGQGLRLAAAGILSGLLGAALLTPLLSGLLFGVAPTDPATFGAIALLLGGAALFACYLPARRATRLDPITILRSE